MQFKVPQNIDLEDKIVGPFTMKQFIYILVSGFIVYGWWQHAQTYKNEMAVFLPLAVPVGLLGVSLALVKINDRPFEIFLLALFRFLFIPKKRMWQEGFEPEKVITLGGGELKQESKEIKTSAGLDDLAKSLDAQSKSIQEKQAPSLPKALAPKVSEGESEQAQGGQTSATEQAASAGGAFNLSVKDVKSASEKQQQAQSAGAPEKKSAGLFGFLKKK